MAAIHAKRVTLQVKDMQFIQDVLNNYGVLSVDFAKRQNGP